MARDYAQRKRSNGKRQNSRKHGGGLPGPVNILVGLTIGLIVAAGVYIAVRPVPNGYQKQNSPSTAAPGQAEKNKPAAKPAAKEQKQERFTFYDMLPNYEIVPYTGKKPVQANPKPSAPPQEQPIQTVDQPGYYVIQAGSFADSAQADQRRAKMALLGIVSHTQNGPGPDGNTRYRVRVGPLQDLNRVNDILKRLRGNGIETLLMRKKG